MVQSACRPRLPRPALRVRIALLIAGAGLLGGCSSLGSDPLAQLLGPQSGVEAAERGAQAQAPAGPQASSASPPALAEARRLRAAGDKLAALELLERSAGADSNDRELLREQGLLALELGRLAKAKTLLTRAVDPAAPDWRVHSALGAALAANGEQPAAQVELAKALRLAPDEPAVINNLALSYALDGKAGQAERLLRSIARQPKADTQDRQKARQNLALLLGVRGQHDEARQIVSATLPRDKAEANLAYLERIAGAPQVSPATPPDATRTAAAPSNNAMRLGAPAD